MRFLKILILSLIGYTSFAQNVKISDMTPATDLNSVTLPIIQGGTNKKAAISLFDTRFLTNSSLGSNWPTALGASLGSGWTTALNAAWPGTSSSPSASKIVLFDANANISATNALITSTSTASAGGTTTLTAASARDQHCTGTLNQTYVLPVASTLNTNQEFWIFNDGTGTVTVTTSGSNTMVAMIPNSILHAICINPSGGTGLASWSYPYYPPNPMTAVGDLINGGTVVNGYATPTRIGAGTAGYVLTSNGAGTNPTWQVGGGLSGLTTNQVMVATSSTTIGGNADLIYGSRSLSIGLSSSGTNTLNLGTGTTDKITSNQSSGEFQFYTFSTHFHTFYSNGVEYMRSQANSHKTLSIGSTSENAALYVNQVVLTSSWLPGLRIDPGAHTGMTAGTQYPSTVFTGSTQTWANGSSTLAEQPYNYFQAPTVNAGSGNTISDTHNGYFEAPVNGTGTTTRLWGLGTNGHFQVQGRSYFGGATTAPTASIHIGAESASASSGPIKFTIPGALMSTPEALVLGPSVSGDVLKFTTTTGTVVRTVVAGSSGRSTAQTAANTSVATYTLGATDASYEVSANVLVTTSSAENFTVTVDYTDDGNTARTLTFNFQTIAGVIGTAINFANGAVPYEGVPVHLRCKASTAITIKTTGTFTGATYNAEGIIKQIQ